MVGFGSQKGDGTVSSVSSSPVRKTLAILSHRRGPGLPIAKIPLPDMAVYQFANNGKQLVR